MRAVAVLLFLAHALCELKIRYKNNLSLFSPYLNHQGKFSYGRPLGDASVISKGSGLGVHLTIRRKDSRGALTVNRPLDLKGWQIDTYLQLERDAQGVGIWLGKEFREGTLFGGSPMLSSTVAFLALNKSTNKLPYPAVGILSTSGGGVRVGLSKSIRYSETCIIRLQWVDGELTLFYGENEGTLYRIGSIPNLAFDRSTYLTISGNTSDENGDITVKTIKVSEVHTSIQTKYIEDDTPSTRSSLVWLVFVVLISGVVYYIYSQKTVVKHKKGLKY